MTSKPVIVVGGGGHARVLLDALLLGSRQVLGIVDADPSKLPAAVRGVPVLGNDDVLQTHGPERVELVLGIGSVAPGSLRERVYLRYRQLGYAFAAVVHPSAVIARDAMPFGVDIAEVVERYGELFARGALEPFFREGRALRRPISLEVKPG